VSQRIQSVYDAFAVERFPLPSEEQVSDLESRLGIPLPLHYRKFILEFNGGFFREPKPLIAPVHEELRWYELDGLWGIAAAHRHAELGNDTNLFDDNDPPLILPIGNTSGNHLLYWLPRMLRTTAASA